MHGSQAIAIQLGQDERAIESRRRQFLFTQGVIRGDERLHKQQGIVGFAARFQKRCGEVIPVRGVSRLQRRGLAQEHDGLASISRRQCGDG